MHELHRTPQRISKLPNCLVPCCVLVTAGIFCDPIPTPPRHHQGPFKCESGRGYEGTECECTMDICKEFGTLSQNILLYCLYCIMKNEMLSRINSPQQNKQKLIFSGGQRLATARNILGILYLVIPG